MISSHISEVLNGCERKNKLNWIEKQLRSAPVGFTTIAVCGTSGLLVGPTIADRMKKKIAVIRKSTKICHSDNSVESEIIKQYIIIDDLVFIGETVRNIVDKIENQYPNARCVGLVLYRGEGYTLFGQELIEQMKDWRDDYQGGPW